MFWVTIHLGWVFYKNGEVWLDQVLLHDRHLVKSVNNLLLAGYYLLNLGYVVLQISFWQEVTGIELLFKILVQKSGQIILLLALMHYFNLFWLLLFGRKQKNKTTLHKI